MEDRPLRKALEVARLTPLQQDILVLILNGLTNQEIGVRLGGTSGMVGTQVGRIVQRLGLTCRSAILAAANGADPVRRSDEALRHLPKPPRRPDRSP